jgi:hypothetical protein
LLAAAAFVDEMRRHKRWQVSPRGHRECGSAAAA